MVLRLTVLLGLADLGFIDARAIAQEFVGEHRWRTAMGRTVLTLEEERVKAARPGSEFRECARGCPVMIVIPAGRFIMGSPENKSERQTSEGPQHEVTFARPFAVSKFEVTFKEWDACVVAGGCPRVADHWGRGEVPVINASWGDAKQYVAWLSQLTGKAYRLLTEASGSTPHGLVPTPAIPGATILARVTQLRWLRQPMGSQTHGTRWIA